MLVLALSPAFSAPSIHQNGDRIVLVGGESWAVLHPDGTWAFIPEELFGEFFLLEEEFLASGEVVEHTPPSIAPRSWTYQTFEDPLTDSRTHVFNVSATSGTSPYGEKPALTVRIRADGRCEIYIAWGVFLGSQPITTWRFDKEPASTARWYESTDSKSAFYFGDTDPFLKKLLGAKQLIVQVTPYSESPIMAYFQVDGFREFDAEHPEVLPLVFGE